MKTHRTCYAIPIPDGHRRSQSVCRRFEDCRLPQERAKVALQLKHLVTPAGMGESFQVLIASKGVEQEKVASL